ncbi:hypothetical protein [Acinetobacter thermotolerans]|uniref:hypothetical protein n=1 Tax=Acinetobacter thermotolerans TaxID=3151487 RepID=UPI00325A719A
MAMKQTQTKYYDCSDVGLDMCFGATAKNPSNFKKILHEGYNRNSVVSVGVSGNQVTLNYGGAHGYKADRVLKIEDGVLSSINGGEFHIDSVTTDTVVLTIDDAPVSIEGGFSTIIAPLGWDLVYESGSVHIYEMLHIDDTPRFVRMFFEPNINYRASVTVCIGKSYDADEGFIDDPNALQLTKNIMATAANIPRWDTYTGSSSYANYTYQQGFNGPFGHGAFTGSKYHLCFQCGDGYKNNGNISHSVYGIFPTACLDYEILDYPVLVAVLTNTAGNGIGPSGGNFCANATSPNDGIGYASIGNLRVRFDFVKAVENSILTTNSNHTRHPVSSLLPTNIDEFNTTTLRPLDIYEYNTSQVLGAVYGLHQVMVNSGNFVPYNATTSPSIQYTPDGVRLFTCASMSYNTTVSNGRAVAVPIEPIKYTSYS